MDFYPALTIQVFTDQGGTEALVLVSMAALLAAVGIVCFVIAIWSSRSKPFTVKRTNLTLSGDNRTEISKPLVFAIGAVLALGLAAGLIIYRPGSAKEGPQSTASESSKPNGK